MPMLHVDVIHDARRMLTKAADRLHQLAGCTNNVDVESQRRAAQYLSEALANIHAAEARLK